LNYTFCLVDVDEDDEEDDEDAEEGYDEHMTHDKGYVRDEGPSARDIDGLLRGKDMWRYVTYFLLPISWFS